MGELAWQISKTLNTLTGKSTAVIYQDETRRRTTTYESVREFAKEFQEEFRSICCVSEYVGVGCSQDVYFPSVLIGILQSGNSFYNLDTSTDLVEQQRPLNMLNIRYIVVDSMWINVHLPKLQNTSNWKVEMKKTLKFKGNEEILEIGKHVEEMTEHEIFILKIQPPSDKMGKAFRTDQYGEFLHKVNATYAARTSGTSGSRKLVLVKEDCININVKSLIDRLDLKMSDTTFGSSPSTFDPSITELFTTFYNCGKILYVSPSIKLNPKKLCATLLQNRITMLPLTPSLYSRFSLDEKNKLLHSNDSRIRAVIFGGEPIPAVNELVFILNGPKAPAQVFNLYGTTEVSVWASIDCITAESLKNQSNPTLGIELEETVLELFDTPLGQEIAIGSSKRLTTILIESTGKVQEPLKIGENIFRMTGDCGKQNDKDPSKLEYLGRLNRSVKRNGSFVDLNFIENCMIATGKFTFIHAFDYLGKIYVLYKPITDEQAIESNSWIFDLISENLPMQAYPDRFVRIKNDTVIPVTVNGKINQEYLRRVVLEEELKPFGEQVKLKYRSEELEDFICNIWQRYSKCPDDKINNDMTFFESGGNSMQATLFVENVLQAFGCRGTPCASSAEKELLRLVLRDPLATIKKFIIEQVCGLFPHYVKNIEIVLNNCDKQMDNEDWIEPETAGQDIKTQFSPTECVLRFSDKAKLSAWKVPLFGCVDTSVVIAIPPPERNQSRVSLAKYNDEIQGELQSPFKSSKKYFPLAIVGAHSGIVVAVDLNTLKTGSSSETNEVYLSCVCWVKTLPDRVAASPVLSPDHEFVYVACCDNHLYCLQTVTGRLKWVFKSDGMLRTSPVISSTQDSYKIIVISDGSKLNCLSPDGAVHLSIALKTDAITSLKPLVIGQKIIAVGRNSTLIEVNVTLDTYETNYFQHDIDSICTEVVQIHSRGKQYYACGTVKGHILACSKGELIWRMTHSTSPWNTPICHQCEAHQPCIVCVSHTGDFLTLNPETGAIVTAVHIKTSFKTSPIMHSNCIVGEETKCVALAIDMSSTVHFIDITKGKVIGFVEPEQRAECFSTPILTDENLLVFGSRDENLHVYDLNCCIDKAST